MTLPQPGYYADPDDPSIERWWDGGKWIGQTRPSQGNPPLPLETPPKVGTSLPPATPSAQGTRPCPDCGGMASVNAQTCVHCGAPLDAVAPEQPQAFSAAEKTGRSGYYAAAWVSLCCRTRRFQKVARRRGEIPVRPASAAPTALQKEVVHRSTPTPTAAAARPTDWRHDLRSTVRRRRPRRHLRRPRLWLRVLPRHNVPLGCRGCMSL